MAFVPSGWRDRRSSPGPRTRPRAHAGHRAVAEHAGGVVGRAAYGGPGHGGRPAPQPRGAGPPGWTERPLHRRPGRLGFGFIEVGTVTPKAQPGNPRPRLFRLPKRQALINRFGFNNAGLPGFRRQRAARTLPAGAAASSGPEHRQERGHADRARRRRLPGRLDGVYPHADYVTVNISSPNTKNLRAAVRRSRRWTRCSRRWPRAAPSCSGAGPACRCS